MFLGELLHALRKIKGYWANCYTIQWFVSDVIILRYTFEIFLIVRIYMCWVINKCVVSRNFGLN